jgi:hypothetical protein
VSFSEKQMQQQINSALSAAVEKLSEDNSIDAKLIEATKVRAENLDE